MKKRFKIPLAIVLILGLAHATAPLWLAAIVRSQLPPSWQLIEADFAYPGWRSVRANRVQLETALAGHRLRITAHGSRLYYSGPVIEITSLSIEVTATGPDIQATAFSWQDFSLPLLLWPGAAPQISVDEVSINLAIALPALKIQDLELGRGEGSSHSVSADFYVESLDSIRGSLEAHLSPGIFEAGIAIRNEADRPLLEVNISQQIQAEEAGTEIRADLHLSETGWPGLLAALFPAGPYLPSGLSGDVKIIAGFGGPMHTMQNLRAKSDYLALNLEKESFSTSFDLMAKRNQQAILLVAQAPGRIHYQGKSGRLAEMLEKLLPQFHPHGIQPPEGKQYADLEIQPGSQLALQPDNWPAARFEGAAKLTVSATAFEIESLLLADLRFEATDLPRLELEQLSSRVELAATAKTPFSYVFDEISLNADEMIFSSIGRLRLDGGTIRYKTTEPLRAELRNMVLDIPSQDGSVIARFNNFLLSGQLGYLAPDVEFSGDFRTLTKGLSVSFNDREYRGLDAQIRYRISSNGEVSGEGSLTFGREQRLPVKFSGSLETQRWIMELLPSEIDAIAITPLMNAVNMPLPKILELQQGTISLSGKAILDPDIRANIYIEGNSINFAAKNSEARGLNFKFTGSLQEVFSISGQISAQSVNLAAGLVLENVTVDIEEAGENSLAIESLSARLFGGALTVPDMHFSGGVLGDSLVRMSEIDLAELLTFADIDGLAGSGALEIHLPLGSDKKGLYIHNGTFNATVPGVLRYTAADPMTISGNIGLQALANFHYQTLDGSIDYSSDGEYRVLVHLTGNNPDVYDGYPIELNLNIGGVLPELFEVLFLTGDFEQAILSRIRIK